jgi:NAD(P)H dehydrogenase (quinone)
MVYAVKVDYEDAQSLVQALRDVDTLVFISSDGESARLLYHHYNIVRAATQCEVAHVIALSGLDTALASPFCYSVSYDLTERLLRDSGLKVSVLRSSIHAEFFLSLMNPYISTGDLRLPGGAAKLSLVSRSDVAESFATVATGEPVGLNYEITGPEALDLAEVASRVADVRGIPLRYTPVEPVEYQLAMAQRGEDSWWQYAFATMFEAIRQGRWSAVSDDISRLTGHPAADLFDVLRQS